MGGTQQRRRTGADRGDVGHVADEPGPGPVAAEDPVPQQHEPQRPSRPGWPRPARRPPAARGPAGRACAAARATRWSARGRARRRPAPAPVPQRPSAVRARRRCTAGSSPCCATAVTSRATRLAGCAPTAPAAAARTAAGRRAWTARRSRRTAAPAPAKPGSAAPAAVQRPRPSCARSVGDRQRAVGQRRGRAGPCPRRSADRGRDDVHPAVGVVDPVDRHLVDPQPGPLGQHQQLGVEEPAGVLDQRQQLSATSARIALNPHCASEKPGGQRAAQQQVVAAARSARAWGRAPPGTLRASRVPIARSEWPGQQRRDQRQQRGQVGGQVDVHVRQHRRVGADHAARSARPRPFAQVQHAHTPGSSSASRAAIATVASVLALSATVIRPGEWEVAAEVRVQPRMRARSSLLVVDRDDDLDVRSHGSALGHGLNVGAGGETTLWSV